MFHLRSSVLLSTCLLLFFFVTINKAEDPPQVIGSSRPIRAAPGEDATLPCHLEPKYNVEGLTVEWAKPDLKPDPADKLSRVEYVHLYRDRREVPDMKIRSYLQRTELFTDALKNGNISLKIKNVTVADEGRYRCFIPKLKSPVIMSIVQLVVVAPQSDQDFTMETPQHPRNPSNPPNLDDDVAGRRRLSALIPMAVCVLLLLAAGVGACLHERKHRKQNVKTQSEYSIAPTAPLTV